MAFEIEEAVEEKRDYTKLLWAVVAILFVLMIGAMFLFSKTKPKQSVVVAKHILISCDFEDVADRTRALNLAKELRQRIQNGESFAKLAREYSGDPTTARTGGLLPPVARGEYDKAFEQYAWSAPVGQLSNPIATSYGYHLIEVVDRQIHEVELYESDLERRANEELRKKNLERATQVPQPSAPTPPAAPAPAQTAPPAPPAPAPAPAVEAPAPAAEVPAPAAQAPVSAVEVPAPTPQPAPAPDATPGRTP